MAISKLHPVALGISVGIITGVSIFAMGMMAHLFLVGKPVVAAIGTSYLTYNPSPINSALGGVLGFVNAFIGGYLAAWIYNLLIDRL